jgi:hypothetical protein
MEEEKVLSGYCRTLDKSRMVLVLLEDGKLTEVDCDYPGCPHIQSCSIAAQLNQ